MKITAIVFGLASVVVLAGCSGNSENMAACTEAKIKLTNAHDSIGELSGRDNTVELLGDMAGIFAILAANLSTLESSSSGDVANEVHSAAYAANDVVKTITEFVPISNEEALATFKGVVTEGGTLDKACQAVGSTPFNTGW